MSGTRQDSSRLVGIDNLILVCFLIRPYFSTMHAKWPVYDDLWGYPVNWTNPQDGWDDEMRQSMLQLTHYIKEQSSQLAPYTQRGYKKISIPSLLYNHILGGYKICNNTVRSFVNITIY